MFTKADWMDEAVKVPIMAWKATSARLMIFYICQLCRFTLRCLTFRIGQL